MAELNENMQLLEAHLQELGNAGATIEDLRVFMGKIIGSPQTAKGTGSLLGFLSRNQKAYKAGDRWFAIAYGPGNTKEVPFMEKTSSASKPAVVEVARFDVPSNHQRETSQPNAEIPAYRQDWPGVSITVVEAPKKFVQVLHIEITREGEDPIYVVMQQNMKIIIDTSGDDVVLNPTGVPYHGPLQLKVYCRDPKSKTGVTGYRRDLDRFSTLLIEYK